MKLFVVSILITMLGVAVPTHAGRRLPKELRNYVTLFEKYDPESIFLGDNIKFDHDKFEKAYMSFFRSLQKNPKRIERIKWAKITPLMRGILAHSRCNDKLMPLLATLPIYPMFRELLMSFFELNESAKQQFEQHFPTPKTKELESFRNYLHIENDLMMSGDIMLFMCLIYRETENPRTIQFFESFTQDLLRQPKTRLRLMIVKHAALSARVLEQLVNLVNDRDSPYYFLGSRFNIVGHTISTLEQEISSSSEELSGDPRVPPMDDDSMVVDHTESDDRSDHPFVEIDLGSPNGP